MRMRMVRNKASMLRNKESVLRNRSRDFRKSFAASECLTDLSVESDVPIAKHWSSEIRGQTMNKRKPSAPRNRPRFLRYTIIYRIVCDLQ
jgi:hypothetical protein